MMFKKVNFLFLFLLSGMVVVQASHTSKVLKSTNPTTTNSNIKNPNSRKKLELEKQQLTSSSSSSEKLPGQPLTLVQERCQGGIQNQPYNSDCTNFFIKSGIFCCLVGTPTTIITMAVLFTKWTKVDNELDYYVKIKSRHTITDPIERKTLYAGDKITYSNCDFDLFCIEADPLKGYDEHCQKITCDKGGCGDVYVTVEENKNNGDPKFAIKECGTEKRRLRGTVDSSQIEKRSDGTKRRRLNPEYNSNKEEFDNQNQFENPSDGTKKSRLNSGYNLRGSGNKKEESDNKYQFEKLSDVMTKKQIKDYAKYLIDSSK